jgi:hypothetical protein
MPPIHPRQKGTPPGAFFSHTLAIGFLEKTPDIAWQDPPPARLTWASWWRQLGCWWLRSVPSVTGISW